jgi:HK97 gp10 family phage protein
MAKRASTPFLNAARKGGKSETSLIGADDLIAALKQMTQDVQGVHLQAATASGAEIVRVVASQLAPSSVRGSRGNAAGHLSKSIAKEKQWTRTQDTADVYVGMTKDAYYGRFAEIGTRYHPATPFLRPALDTTKESVVNEIAEHLRARIFSKLGVV